MAAEAGWYDDGTGRQRWWDGTRWTEHYAEMSDYGVELHADVVPPVAVPTAAGWYDDRRGRLRWWDGKRWTTHARFSGSEQQVAGVVLDGRWVHCGDRSQPVAGTTALYEPLSSLDKRTGLTKAVARHLLFGPSGRITPGQLGRVDRRSAYLAIDGPEEFWLAAVHPNDALHAQRFVGWVNAASSHYLYR